VSAVAPSSHEGTDGLAVVETGPAHAALVAALRAECFDDGGWSTESVAALLGTPGTFALIAEVAGEPAGFILGRAAADEAEILSIGVPPALRRGGIAGRLLDAALARLGAAGIGRVFLEVGVNNGAALALYASHGFKPAGRRPAYYAKPGGPAEDALVLGLGLTGEAPGT
jgi:ribosomal-protein-alanine N-acetyltransferase